MSESLETRHHNLYFGVRRSVRYHERREGSLLFLRNAADFMVFVLGSVTALIIVELVGSEWPILWRLAVPIGATLLTGAALVCQWAAKGALHSELKRRFIALERKLVRRRGNLTEDVMGILEEERLTIQADEPPVLRVLDTICHNDMVHAMRLPREHIVPVTFLQRLFAPFFDFQREKIYRPA